MPSISSGFPIIIWWWAFLALFYKWRAEGPRGWWLGAETRTGTQEGLSASLVQPSGWVWERQMCSGVCLLVLWRRKLPSSSESLCTSHILSPNWGRNRDKHLSRGNSQDNHSDFPFSCYSSTLLRLSSEKLKFKPRIPFRGKSGNTVKETQIPKRNLGILWYPKTSKHIINYVQPERILLLF